MEYRKVGRTGLSTGVIGLGSEHLDRKPYAVVEETIHAALDNGINLMDLFMPGEEVRSNIGRALAGRRDKIRVQPENPAVVRLYLPVLCQPLSRPAVPKKSVRRIV